MFDAECFKYTINLDRWTIENIDLYIKHADILMNDGDSIRQYLYIIVSEGLVPLLTAVDFFGSVAQFRPRPLDHGRRRNANGQSHNFQEFVDNDCQRDIAIGRIELFNVDI